MQLVIPDFCLVVLVGAYGSGKSAFARAHFEPNEIVSAAAARVAVSGNAEDGSASADAAEVMCTIIEKRLKRRLSAVVDAINLRVEDRTRLVSLARRCHAAAVAIVLDPGDDVCRARSWARTAAAAGGLDLDEQLRRVREHANRLDKEGFRVVHKVTGDASAVRLVREPVAMDRRREQGPFDIIGDVHGCAGELMTLLQRLGYRVDIAGSGMERRAEVRAPAGRRAVFVGDLVDRGPNSPDVLRIVMDMVSAGQALAVPGNHDVKLLRWLDGRNVKMTHGIDRTIAQLAAEPEALAFKDRVRGFLNGLVSHVWLEDGRLAVAHAGIREDMIGRTSGAVREFCLYGETSGETDEFGLPVRYNWAAEYRGATAIVYGHTPVPDAQWLNNTLCVDTGCCFGGKLTALRWPERDIVSVPASAVYSPPIRPFGHPPTRPGVALARGR